ncbi:MAG: TraX family protein [Eubacteriales bacterium]
MQFESRIKRKGYSLKEKTINLTSNTLKIIAIILMFTDHLAAGFIPHESTVGVLLRIPGRIVAPIMCFFIAEGFFYTSNLKKYIWRLFIFSLISHIPYILYFDYAWWEATGVIWGLLLGLIALAATKSDQFTIWKKLLIIALCSLFSIIADWNYVSVLWIVSFGVFKGQHKKQMISFILIGFVFHIIPSLVNFGWWHIYQLGIILTIPLLTLYKGNRGKRLKIIKWGFYIFYPLHLILLYILRYITMNR